MFEVRTKQIFPLDGLKQRCKKIWRLKMPFFENTTLQFLPLTKNRNRNVGRFKKRKSKWKAETKILVVSKSWPFLFNIPEIFIDKLLFFNFVFGRAFPACMNYKEADRHVRLNRKKLNRKKKQRDRGKSSVILQN